MVYKSIFDRLKNYKSNPINEYNKISNYIENLYFNYSDSFLSYLNEAHYYCNDFRIIFPELNELLDSTCGTISSYTSIKNFDNYFSDDKKETLLNEFLTYCQIILTLIFVFRKHKNDITNYNMTVDVNNSDTDYCLTLISTSLKSFGYKYICPNNDHGVEIISENPIAESVAAMSDNTISDPIYLYLGTRDIKAKETYLHDLIDSIEPLLKKYSDQNLIKKIREYVQLVRHPEVKKDEKEYKWFFENKKQYLDELFMACIFIQQYDLTKALINKFEILKKPTNGI